MNLKDFTDGLAILRTYFTNPDGYHLGAEHDEIFVHTTDAPLTAEDAAKLRALGWFQPEVEEPEEGEAEYDPEEGWCCFV